MLGFRGVAPKIFGVRTRALAVYPVGPMAADQSVNPGEEFRGPRRSLDAMTATPWDAYAYPSRRQPRGPAGVRAVPAEWLKVNLTPLLLFPSR